MYKKLNKVNDINFENIYLSKLPILSFEFKNYSNDKLNLFLNNIINKFGYKDVSFIYNIDYKGWEEFYDSNLDLSTYTGIDEDNKYLKLGYGTSNISEELPIYTTSTDNMYIHILEKRPKIDLIYNMCIDFYESNFIPDLFFIHISDYYIIYPHSDYGFGIIDINGKNVELTKYIISFFEGDHAKFFGNKYIRSYLKDNSINILN